MKSRRYGRREEPVPRGAVREEERETARRAAPPTRGRPPARRAGARSRPRSAATSSISSASLRRRFRVNPTTAKPPSSVSRMRYSRGDIDVAPVQVAAVPDDVIAQEPGPLRIRRLVATVEQLGRAQAPPTERERPRPDPSAVDLRPAERLEEERPRRCAREREHARRAALPSLLLVPAARARGRSRDREPPAPSRRARRTAPAARCPPTTSRARLWPAAPTTAPSRTATERRLPAGFPSNHQSNASPPIAPPPQASPSNAR